MANVDAKFGLRPIKISGAGSCQHALETFYVPASDSDAIYIGDPVILAGSADADGIPTVKLATAGSSNNISGVVVGVVPETDDSEIFRVPSKDSYVLVATDVNQLFEIRVDGELKATDIGANANLKAGDGSDATGFSGFSLDASSIGSDENLQLVIDGVSQSIDNELGLNAVAHVRLNLHQKRNKTGI